MKTKKTVRPQTRAASKKRQAARRQVPLHRRFLVHPATIFMLLCIGVFIVNWSYRVIADDINVTAKVAAASLSTGATITSPVNGAVYKTSPIDVTGSCPPNSYVKLLRNSTFSGSAWCQPDQTFLITTQLSPGRNDLVVQDYNITDDPGPTTPGIFVIYDVAAPPILPPAAVQKLLTQVGLQSSPKQPALSTPLIIVSDYSFRSFAVNSRFQWLAQVNGGTGPYVLQIEWNDGSSSLQAVKAAGNFTITHKYKKAGYYAIKLKAVDADGHQANLQLAGLIHQRGKPFVLGSTTTPTNPPGLLDSISPKMWLIWSSYGSICLMAFSFWLGERQEYMTLAGRRYAGKHR